MRTPWSGNIPPVEIDEDQATITVNRPMEITEFMQHVEDYYAEKHNTGYLPVKYDARTNEIHMRYGWVVENSRTLLRFPRKPTVVPTPHLASDKLGT